MNGDGWPAEIESSKINLAKRVRSPDEVNERTLIGVRRQENLLPKRLPKCVHPSCKVQTLEHVQSACIHSHVTLLVKVDQSGIERSVIRRRKRNAVPYLVHTSGSAHRDDMCCVYEAQL